jgi:carbon starvation protein
MGVYLRFLRPGRVLEVSVIGVTLLLASVYGGKFFHEIPALSRLMTFDGETLAYAIIVYGLLAASVPVWLLLAPRDYLSTFMKLGTISALAVGIVVVMPQLQLPAFTRFVDGTGPVFSGKIFPFCFITIACGAISGFHSLIASGTTPKLITRETDARMIGYGSMLLESAVAIMALIAAATLQPGVYFAINSPAGLVGHNPNEIVKAITSWGFPVAAETMSHLARDLGENSMFDRAGGAPTLAVGMAEIFARLVGGRNLLSLWYHFAIMFEALFILTTIDAGTRVGRFLLQAFLKQIHEPLGNTSSWSATLFSSALLVSAWGYFLVQGVLDPLGGINTLWPLFGIANQLLSVIALCLATTILLKMGYRFKTLATIVPLSWVAIVTFSAAGQKILSSDPHIGFLSAAQTLSARLARGGLSAQQFLEINRTINNLRVDALVAGFFLVLVGAIVVVSVFRWVQIINGIDPCVTSETEPVYLSPEELVEINNHTLRHGVEGAALVVLGVMPNTLKPSAHSHDTCCETAVTLSTQHNSVDEGTRWAASETARFSRPRCC